MFDDLKKDDQNNDQKLTGGENNKPVPAPMSSGNASEAPEKESQPAGPPADIFAETENNKSGRAEEKPAILQPKTEEQFNMNSGESGGRAKKLIMLAVILIILGLFGAGGYYAYDYFSGRIVTEDNADTLNSGGEADTEDLYEEDYLPDEEAPIQPFEEKEILDEEPVEEFLDEASHPVNNTDSDNDGLLDSEEIELGTDINNVDSDNDGLFDREEVKVYKTDPLNSDSDGDGFLDADEIKAGYNPNGEGKLFEIN